MDSSYETNRIDFSMRHNLVNYAYTIIISALIAVFLTFTGIYPSFLPVFLISETFGLSICTIIKLLLWLFRPTKVTSDVLIGATGVAAGTLIGLFLEPILLRFFFSIPQERTPLELLQTTLFAMTFGAIVSYFFFSKEHLRHSRELIQQERIRHLSKEKEVLEANLKRLQAQIEPHFLFNTLSNLLSLIDTNPDRGKAMLLDLIRYLRTSLSRTRQELATLSQEIEIIHAYLNILKIRMGNRLRFRLEVPDSLADQPFPPMLLQPLVENAVQHGLDPLIEGGEILVRIQETDGLVVSEIIDSGGGFASETEAGVGITNVRERLRLLYGERGRLVIEENEPHGVRAIVEIPRAEKA